MPSTEQEWRKRVRGAQRALRDAKRSRRYVFVGQLMGGVVAVAALVLGIVFAQNWLDVPRALGAGHAGFFVGYGG